ncbi:MAG: CPBP family intramembrane glutamic endopeptidase [Acidimicrobiales bacterium]
MGASRTSTALVGVVAVLAVANVARSTVVPSGVHLPFNLATAAAVVAMGAWAQLSRAELGLERDTLGAGIRLGLVVLGVVVVGVAVAAAVSSGSFDDDRARVDGATMALRVLVVIPLGTVLVEELIFRGVVHGLLARLTTPTGALVAGAVLFGLWHVFPAWRGADGDTLHHVGVAVGTLAATTAAGVGFVWLRTRSGSLAAPALAHLATNSVTYAAAWLLTR